MNPVFLSYLKEIKSRSLKVLLFLTLAISVSYYFHDKIYYIAAKPLLDAFQNHGLAGRMIYTSLIEAFSVYLKISIYSGIIFTVPFILLQIYLFMAPALYIKERKMIRNYMCAIPLLFISGIMFMYFVALPIACEFFVSFQVTKSSSSMQIELMPKMGEYVGFIIHILLVFGLIFQMPVIILLLVRLGLISVSHLNKARRWVIVIIFIIAAIVTPPDVVSQLIVAVPMLFLYEISVLLCLLTTKRTNIT